jgi:hypothetical protein
VAAVAEYMALNTPVPLAHNHLSAQNDNLSSSLGQDERVYGFIQATGKDPCRACNNMITTTHPSILSRMLGSIHTTPDNVARAAEHGCSWCSMCWRGVAAFIEPNELRLLAGSSRQAFDYKTSRSLQDVFSISTFYGWRWNRLEIEFYVPEGVFFFQIGRNFRNSI